MSPTMPLFPLGTVLFPGLVLPLHIFEDRYRQLVADLEAGQEPRRFGVIAIRHGRETGVDGVSALYDTGCLAQLRSAEQHADGRYNLVTVGTHRFRLVSLADPAPYPRGEVELLPDEPGEEPGLAGEVAGVQQAFRSYLDLLAEKGGARVSVPTLPDEPVLLSYLVAAAMVIDLPVKQGLLEAADAAARLHAERALLSAECQLLRSLTATPAPDLRYSRYSPN
jgi:Lon protease-like protein